MKEVIDPTLLHTNGTDVSAIRLRHTKRGELQLRELATVGHSYNQWMDTGHLLDIIDRLQAKQGVQSDATPFRLNDHDDALAALTSRVEDIEHFLDKTFKDKN